MRALKAGARTVFMNVWPVLKSLPQIGAAFFFDSSTMRRKVHRQDRRAVGKGHALGQRRIGINLRRRNGDVVVIQALFKGLDRLMNGRRLVNKISVDAPRSPPRGPRSS
jgi:hypothetical protein